MLFIRHQLVMKGLSLKVSQFWCQQMLQNVRAFSQSSVLSKSTIAKTSANREVRFMKKMVSGSGKSGGRRFTYNLTSKDQLADFGFLSGDRGQAAGKGRAMSGRVRRRIDVLNNLFVEQITSLLGTGEVSPEFLGLGIQISKVKTISDFSGVNVYWYATGTEKDEKIEQLLSGAAGHLRHVLTQLRVIGIVPPIHFFKDSTFSKLQEVDYLLTKCDTGPDFTTPSKSSTTLPQTNEKGEVVEYVMRQDVLGVRHDVIMKEIMKAMERKSERKLAKEKALEMRAMGPSTAYPNKTEDSDAKEEDAHDDLSTRVDHYKKRQREFMKYLKERRSEKEKMLKSQSTLAAENEFYSSVREERIKNQLKENLEAHDFQESEDDYDDFDEVEVYDEDLYYKSERERFQ